MHRNVDRYLDNMWAICGSPVRGEVLSRMVECAAVDMLRMNGARLEFYQKSSID
ncbi:MAG: hypothetical protein JWQ88_1883 [Rhodoferax sp.]|nr:hypothetical protein [Rhodoferax sp.]